MKHQFQVGDRVRLICSEFSVGMSVGQTGTVREADEISIGVESDNHSNGHSLNGLCQNGHGWWIHSANLELIEEESVEDELADLDGLLYRRKER